MVALPIEIGNMHDQQMSEIGFIIFPLQLPATAVDAAKAMDAAIAKRSRKLEGDFIDAQPVAVLPNNGGDVVN